MEKWKTPKLKKLAQTLVAIDDEKEMTNFLRDLCTLDELKELSARWEAVQLLNKGIPYREISEKTKLSTTTVTRIAYWLKNGEGGYLSALQKTKIKP